ncbi:hypothetical protein RPK_00270 [Rickettsia rickettsii str. Hlp|nr:hypothetical protein RPK_00270 [Rickettsia rickettsii str. Hlp\
MVNVAQNININDINLYGFNGVFTIIEGNPTTRVSINNITNVDNLQTQRAVQNALVVPLAYGANNNAEAKLKLISGNGTGSELTITGNDISAVESIELVFKEKVDMKHRNGSVIDTGNLEFISFGKVRVNKGFTGNITTTKTMRGEVTFVKIPDIYEIGSQTKQVSKVMFEGNHEHKLHNDIHSRQTNFDSGTYNIRTQDITINGNANVNGSTFDLRRNVILIGDVVLEGNITINALGESGIVFHNLPRAFCTNIVININRGSHGE